MSGMEYNGEGVEALVAVMSDIETSSIIMLDKKIKALLKCLAYYDEFRTVLRYCNQSFDYDGEKRKALQRVGERKVLRLPRQERQLVALAAGMLLEFDAGTMDLVTFIEEYFPAPSKQESYKRWFQGLLDPFKQALVGLVVRGEDDTPKCVERTVDFASESLRPQAEYLLTAFVKNINDLNVSQDVREEYLLMIEGFAAALDTRDTLIIKAMWTGIRRTFFADSICLKEVAACDELLKMYLISK